MDRYLKIFSKNLFISIITTSIITSSAFCVENKWSAPGSWAQEAANDDYANTAPTRRSFSERTTSRKKISPFAPGTNNLALGVGQVFLMGDLGEYNSNIGGQMQYTYGVSDIFGFNADLGYSKHSDGKFSQISLLTGLRTNFVDFDKVTPFAKFGLGFYRQNQEIANNLTINPLLFGLHIGPGVDLEISKELYFGADLTLHDIFNSTVATALGPRTVGGTYMTFFLHLGTTF